MTARMKKVVYLQRQVQKHADCTSAMLSVTGFIFARCATYIPTVCQPRERLVMGFSSACNGLDDGLDGTPSFSCHKVKSITQMKHTNKTTGRDPQSITFMPEWLDFTQHLTNAQFGRLARCVARFERGDINREHVAELRKDAAVGVAYNFITDQISRRAIS